MTNNKPCIAIVDDEAAQRALLGAALQSAGYCTVACANGEEALRAAPDCSLILLDVRMPGLDGLAVLEILRRDRPALPVILLTAFIDLRDAVNAIKLGALDYLEKPVDLDELIAAVDDALGQQSATPTTTKTSPDAAAPENPAMKRVLEQAARVADSEVSVLILGESGVGKEVLARFIHQHSRRAAQAIVRVDCGALPEHLVESELFGHEKGAFTGAGATRKGQFEMAQGGTVFLDEIGELPLALQPKFLHVLESGRFRRVGGSHEIQSDARLIAATNRDLEAEVREGRFRQDLFYRLNVFPLTIPPLRERKDDILALTDHFLRPRKLRLAPAAERLMMGYHWPGNVRELRNVLERAAVLADGSLILPHDLPPQLNTPAPAPATGAPAGRMDEVQRQAILDALRQTGGNKTRAAEQLGISRRNLIYKLRDYGY